MIKNSFAAMIPWLHLRRGAIAIGLMFALLLPALAGSGHWRGPEQNGVFPDKDLPSTWSAEGENLLWKAPFGSRSAPLIMNNRVYMINRASEGETLQERVICLDIDTGKVIWEHRFNAFLTDIVAHRLGWSNLCGDPFTGHIYAHGVQGMFFCFSKDGNVIWKKSLTEEYGRISGYGGRTNTPIIWGDLVVMSSLTSSWGAYGRGKHRFWAMNKLSGEMVWWSDPGEAPLDTTYSVPVMRHGTLIVGIADGSVVRVVAETGETLWRTLISKRGINSSVVVSPSQKGKMQVYAMHSEENLEGNVMGSLVCLDFNDGSIIWERKAMRAGYTSPVLAGDLLFIADNSANLHCLDAATGETHWMHNYGSEGKGSPVYADGKIYVGEVGGSYSVLKVSKETCEVLDHDEFIEDTGIAVEIFGTPTVAQGRVFLPTRTDIYCIATKPTPVADALSMDVIKFLETAGDVVNITPAEVTLNQGGRQKFEIQSGIASLIRSSTEGGAAKPVWSLEGLKGEIDAHGLFISAPSKKTQAGHVVATIGDKKFTSRVRVMPSLPYEENFDELPDGIPPAGWISSKLKSKVEPHPDGGKVLRKLGERSAPPFTRLRNYMMGPMPANYTVQADMFGIPKKRRFWPDMGLINARYVMIALNDSVDEPSLRLTSWAAIPRVQKDIPFAWEPDTWYTMKLSVQVKEGQGIIRGKLWKRGEAEPDAWTIEMTDPVPNTEGAPGLYGYSTMVTDKSKGTEVLFDNVKVFENP